MYSILPSGLFKDKVSDLEKREECVGMEEEDGHFYISALFCGRDGCENVERGDVIVMCIIIIDTFSYCYLH